MPVVRILLVKPNMGLVRGRPYHDRGRMEPLTCAVLAGHTPPGHEVALCDDRMEPVPYGEPWDLVAITTEVYTARRAYEIAGRFRAAGVKVVIGGIHATLVPEEAAAHADAVAVGDTDGAWAGIVADAAAGRLAPRYGPAPAACAAPAAPPRTGLFDGRSYVPVALTSFGRGCPGRCEYCATASAWGGRHRVRPVGEVLGEIERRRARAVFFVDDNLVSDPDAAKELLHALIPLKVRWVGQATLEAAWDAELLRLMGASGCAGLVVGFESRDPENLRLMRKGPNLAHPDYDAAVARFRDAGILLWAAFLLGCDRDTPESIRDTVAWALGKRFAFAAFNVLTPYPGTPFYERMRDEGRLLYGGRWWLHDDYRFGAAAFRPHRMSPETLTALGLWARRRHSSVFQILRRASDRRTNSKDLWSLFAYLAYNPLFRDELLKKHGMALGYRGLEREAPRGGAGRPEDGVASALLQLARRPLEGLMGRLG